MKTKLFTLLALFLFLNTFTAKAAAPVEPQVVFNNLSYAPNNYFGGYLCTWTTLTENGVNFARFTRPANASLAYGPQWGYVDYISFPSQQSYPNAIAGGNLTFGTNQASYWEFITVRMRKTTPGKPQINLASQTQSNTIITSTTNVVVGEWVSYLFDVSINSGTAYKMLTVIPDGENVACSADISNVYATNAPLSVTTKVNDPSMGTVSGGGSYPTANSAILTATPKSGYRFVNWTNVATSSVVSSATTYTYALTGGAIALQANFVAGYTIAASSNDINKGTVAGAGGFDGSLPVLLTATVIAGNRFIGWVENGILVSTDLIYTFTPTSNRTLIAYFGVAATNYTSAAPAALTYVYGTVGTGGVPAFGTQGSVAIDYIGSGDVTVTLSASPSYEISLTNNGPYSADPIVIPADGSTNVTYKTIYVHLKEGLPYLSSYPNTLTITPTIGTPATISLTGSVSKKPLFINNVTNVRRYNGTTTASGISGTLVGIVGSDDVAITGAGTFNSNAAAAFKTVTVTLGGTTAGNYSCTIVGHILAKWLNVGLVSPSSKVYDGANTSTLPTGPIGSLQTAEASAAGTENDGKPYTGDAVTLTSATVTAAAYNNLNIYAAYQINYTGPSLSNTNYTLAYPSVITPKPLTVTTAPKVYDGTTSATATLNGKVGTEGITLNGSLAFGDANVGTAKPVSISSPLSLSSTIIGAGTSNYSLTQPTGLTANITAKPLTLPDAAAVTKVYDGTTNAVITGTLTGVITVDVPNVTLVGTGTFADAIVGTAKPVTSTSTLTGSAAGNYSLTQPIGLVADITIPTGVNPINENGFFIVKGRSIQLEKAVNSVEVYNTLGVCLLSKQQISEGTSIAISSSGVYLIKITNEQGMKVQKIIIH